MLVAMSPTTSHLPPQLDHNPANSPVQDSLYNPRVSAPQPSDEMLSILPPLPPNKRPKLSLQTSSLPVTFGKSSTALTITASALSTASPTVLNTFNNAYDIPRRSSPVTFSPAASRSARPSSRLTSPYPSTTADCPYQLPLGVKGILRNTPVASSLYRSSICSRSASPRNGRRVFFPPTKKVTYRCPLEDEIKTVNFVACHSDLSSPEEPLSQQTLEGSTEESDEESLQSASEDDNDQHSSLSSTKRKGRHHRQIEAAALRDEISHHRGDNTAHPRWSRRKRPRQWEWTLGSVDEAPGEKVDGGQTPVQSPAKQSRPRLTVDTSSTSTDPAPPSVSPMPREMAPSPWRAIDDRSPSQIALPQSPLPLPLPSPLSGVGSPLKRKAVEEDHVQEDVVQASTELDEACHLPSS